jgi:hypothetical protein
MNNLSPDEIIVVGNHLAILLQLEQSVPGSSDNLDSEAAGAWTHNPNEVADRLRLLNIWCRRLCAFLGVPPGDGLGAAGLAWVV